MTPPNRQYIAVVFDERGGSEYTYHNDGEPVKVGDVVEVVVGKPNKTGYPKRQKVTVVRIVEIKPEFFTKPISLPEDPEAALIDA